MEPVTFAAGSAVVSPAMEEHLIRVADFLRRSPFVNLALTRSRARADVEALKDEAVAARLRRSGRSGACEDAAAALAAYYKERLPDVPVPRDRGGADGPAARARDGTPDASLADLARRRDRCDARAAGHGRRHPGGAC